uniref:Cationic amino acid transporter 5 n=1 Tax=Anthurium amnicola TaxID=1678845 RepID=A0A1D1Y8C2_9ARAE
MAPGGGAADGAGSGSDSSRYWRWSKADFFPEPSFSSWSSYASALSQTFPRLRSRLLRRSSSSAELRLLPLRSHHALRRCLSWWDLAWLGFGAVVGSGVFVLTGLEARENSGPAVVLSYAAAGFTALLSVFCYTEFAVEIPVAGGSFAYLRVELGDLVSYLAAANILLEAVVGAAGIARSWTSYFAALLDRPPDSLRIPAPALADGFNLLDPIAVVALVTCSAIAASGTRLTSALNWVTSLVGVAVIAFIIGAGSTRADSSNLSPFFPFGARGVFRAAGVVYWSYTGFDMVATMAEETRNPARDIPIGLLGSMVSITVVYCAMALVLCSMQSYAVLDPDAAYSVAFAAVGMRWAKYLVALGALKGMTTGMLVGALGQGRYTTQIARAHMIPPYFALVHPRTGTTVHATILVTGASACIALFSSLDVLATVSSISTLFVFMLVAVALLVRRYYAAGHTQPAHRNLLVAFLLLILLSSVATAAYWATGKDGWVPYVVTGPVWFLSTLGLHLLVPKAREPKLWGVPMVPWLPSASIGINIFLLGSIDAKSFMRFGAWTAFLLLYYFFIGLHSSYDTAKASAAAAAAEPAKRLEEGTAPPPVASR